MPRSVRGGARLLVLRAVVALAPVLALLLGGVAGSSPSTWFVVVVAVLSCGWALFPESAAGLGVLVLVVGWWAVGPDADEQLHAVVLVVACCLVAAHVAALLASYGPPEAVVPGDLVRTWARRGVLVALPVPVLLVLARLLDGEAEVPGAWTAGLVGVLVVAVGALVALRPARDVEAGR